MIRFYRVAHKPHPQEWATELFYNRLDSRIPPGNPTEIEMPVPDYQTVMLPLLRLTSDGNEHTLVQSAEAIADEFRLADEERKEMLSGSGQLKIYNRVGWARTYMAKAGLLEAVGRGKFKITERGLELLKTKPKKIDVNLLNQFPEFVEFRTGSAGNRLNSSSGSSGDLAAAQQTPQELLESSYQTLHQQVADDLLERISKSSPRFFERLVVDLLVAMGYGGSRKDAGQALHTGKSGDDGIDGIIKEDRLGLDAVYVQAKRWKATVGRPEVQGFAGSLEGHRARKGVFITTSQFSADAREYVSRIEKKIILVDGQQLASLSIEFGVGVEAVSSYKTHRIDTDYFEEE
jgi:restriction system protein